MFGSEGDKVAGRLRGGGNQPKASNKQTNSGAAIGVRAQSRLLLDRLDLLAGEGAGEGARRRRAPAVAEGTAAAERSAQKVAILESREGVRRGRFMGRETAIER